MFDPAFLKRGALLLLLCLFVNEDTQAQPCSGTISTYPYFEGFETNNGNWISGGVASDWAWGTPVKSVITGAGEGTKCWITGGLNKNSYNDNQRSWLLSPCFDFTSLKEPELEFKIFWDTEREVDGGTLQYSLDNGNTWLFIGEYSLTPVTCESKNWYQGIGVFYLSGWRGWGGNTLPHSVTDVCFGGGGSLTWLDAKHLIHDLGGKPSVRFRFSFGSGPSCNNFDGFAIDAFSIKESPANTMAITYKCSNDDDRKVDFGFDATCVTSYQWNFGDPASGAQNISTTETKPSHIFSGPGKYTVTLHVDFLYGNPVTTSEDVVIIDAGAVINWPGKCSNIADATLSVNPTGSPSPYTYSWNTTPPQTGSSISNVGTGNYAVIINSTNACPRTENFKLTGSTTMTSTPVITKSICGNANGTVDPGINGGVQPLQYLWSNGQTGSLLRSVPAGAYSVNITDANGCQNNFSSMIVGDQSHIVPVSFGADITVCAGQSFYLNPGTFSTYTWQDGSHAPVFKVIRPGQYSVRVKDGEGCEGKDTINISANCKEIYFPTAFSPDGNGRNDGFGPMGDLYAIAGYKLSIYDRFGNRVFIATDPFQKWNGQYKNGLSGTQSFVWISEYIYNGVHKTVKGNMVMIR